MSDETDYEVAQRGHNADSRRGADLGGILTERDITHPVNLVFDRPLSADVAGQVFRGGLAADRLVTPRTATADLTCTFL